MKSISSNVVFKTVIFTGLALLFFAANSVLCRMALGAKLIDAPSFTIIRLSSGIIVLAVIVLISGKRSNTSARGSWSASSMLFLYAITFSFAYITLDTGTGALILFATVQITMILLATLSGYRLYLKESIGIAITSFGFVYLVLPNISQPSAAGLVLMTISGFAWGMYTFMGNDSDSPLMDTAFNFFRTLPFIVFLGLLSMKSLNFSNEGIVLAALSGGLASGIGYTLWYMALSGLSPIQAGVLQLLVPIIAAIGGVVFVSEPVTLHLLIAATIMFGGILLMILGRQ